MIYNKPRKVNVERAKRYLARTTPDEITTYIPWLEMGRLIDRNNLINRPEMVQMKVIFSLLMDHWVKRMKIKHPSIYRNIELYAEFDISRNLYILTARVTS